MPQENDKFFVIDRNQ